MASGREANKPLWATSNHQANIRFSNRLPRSRLTRIPQFVGKRFYSHVRVRGIDKPDWMTGMGAMRSSKLVHDHRTEHWASVVASSFAERRKVDLADINDEPG